MTNHARILVDCSSDIMLQDNFLEVVNKRTGSRTAGISHPNVFYEKLSDGQAKYTYGRINKGIDIRFYSLDLFQDKHVYDLLSRFPSYDYGAGIERILCGIAIFPAKPLGCYGDGGAVFTDNNEWAELLRSYCVHGKGKDKYDNVRIGMNSRLDTLQAAILLEKMKFFDDEIKNIADIVKGD